MKLLFTSAVNEQYQFTRQGLDSMVLNNQYIVEINSTEDVDKLTQQEIYSIVQTHSKARSICEEFNTMTETLKDKLNLISPIKLKL